MFKNLSRYFHVLFYLRTDINFELIVLLFMLMLYNSTHRKLFFVSNNARHLLLSIFNTVEPVTLVFDPPLTLF